MKKDQFRLGLLYALVSEVLFGFSFLFTKKVTGSLSPLTLLSWRFTAAFLAFNLCALAGVIRLDFRGKPVASLIPVVVFQPVLSMIGEAVGVQLTTASESGVMMACIPVAALLFSALILKVPPTRKQTAGVAIATAGVLTVVLAKGLEATFNPAGYAMLLLSVLSAGLYMVYSQKASAFTGVEKTYAMVACGAVVFSILALVEHAKSGTILEFASLPFTNPDFLAAVLYLSLGCSVTAFFMYNTAIAAIGSNRTASFVGVCTVVSVAAGAVLLKEKVSLMQIAGTALVLGGVTLANVHPGSTKPAVENLAEAAAAEG